MDPDDEDVLVVRSVEDRDLARPRGLLVDAPQVVVGQLLLGGPLERRHLHALRVDLVEHVADGAVLAARVGGLDHDEHLVRALGVEELLEVLEPVVQLLGSRLGVVAVQAAVVVGLPAVEVDVLAG